MGPWGLGSEGGEEGRDHEDRGKKLGVGQGEVRGRLGEASSFQVDCSSLQIQAFQPEALGVDRKIAGPLLLGAPQDHEGLRSPA